MTAIPWEWQEKALCRTIDLTKINLIDTILEPDEDQALDDLEPEVVPEVLKSVADIFYVDDWEEEKVERAKSFCARCEVQEACLDFAIGTREREGIWGGLTGNERRSLIHKMRKEDKVIPKYTMTISRGINQ